MYGDVQCQMYAFFLPHFRAINGLNDILCKIKGYDKIKNMP